jgi:hypothetical protein
VRPYGRADVCRDEPERDDVWSKVETYRSSLDRNPTTLLPVKSTPGDRSGRDEHRTRLEQGQDRVDRVPRFEDAGAGLEQEGVIRK